jgi:fructose-bisphosphate aldolase class II
MAELLAGSRRGGWAVPNLWGGTTEKVIGHLAAAEARGSPLMLCYNEGLCPQLPMEIGVPLVVNAARVARVPVATILDHGHSEEQALRAMELGISSVMFDGSHLSYVENVRRTRAVVESAHARGVSVEAELGAVGGSAIETGGYGTVSSRMTDPDQAVDFVRQTGVDALAISFGNMHGMYRGKPLLDLALVREIARRVPVPLVMHGGSGLDDSEYPRIIAAGISKINYYSAMARRAAQNMKARLQASCADPACHHLVAWSIEFYTEETARLLDLFNCSGKTASAAALTLDPAARETLVEEITRAMKKVLADRSLRQGG